MKKNKVFIAVMFLGIVILPLLSACQVLPVGTIADALAAPPEAASAEFDYQAAADLSAYRWVEMAKGYERLGLLNEKAALTALDAGDISAYRWLEMAKGYERLGLLNDKMDAGDLSAYRWVEMAKGYERLGMLNNKMDAGDISAFRWLAIAKGYERLGLLNEK